MILLHAYRRVKELDPGAAARLRRELKTLSVRNSGGLPLSVTVKRAVSLDTVGDRFAGGGMFHDPLLSTAKRVFLHFRHNWVILALVLRFPFIPNKSFAIPLLAWLFRTKKDCKERRVPYRTHTEMMREMIAMVAGWAPDRLFEFTGDSAYGCATVVKQLPANVQCVGRVRMDAALYEPAPLRKRGDKGRPRKKGERLPTPKALAEDATIPADDDGTALLRSFRKRRRTWNRATAQLPPPPVPRPSSPAHTGSSPPPFRHLHGAAAGVLDEEGASGGFGRGRKEGGCETQDQAIRACAPETPRSGAETLCPWPIGLRVREFRSLHRATMGRRHDGFHTGSSDRLARNK